MYTYVQQPVCKKGNTATYVYIRAGSRTPTRAYVRPGLVYMAGSEWRNSVVVVFMGRQRNASCSSGGNGTHGSQPAWTKQPMETRPGVPQNGGNGLVFDRTRLKRDPVHREGSGIPQNGGNGLVLERLRLKRGPVHPPPPGTVHPNPPATLTVHPEAASIGFS